MPAKSPYKKYAYLEWVILLAALLIGFHGGMLWKQNEVQEQVEVLEAFMESQEVKDKVMYFCLNGGNLTHAGKQYRVACLPVDTR